MSGERTDRRPPAAARRGLQPGQDPLRPAARLPAVRRRRGDGRAGRRLVRRPRTSPTWSPARWSARSRPPRRSPRRSALPVAHRRAADRGRQRLRGHAGRRRRRRAARTRGTGGSCATRSGPSWGEPYVEIAARMLAAVEAARDAARGHEAVWSATSCRSGRCGCTSRAAATCTTRAGAQCGAGQRHLGHLRRRPVRRHRLRRARRRHRPRRGARAHEAAARPAAGGRCARCSPAAPPARAPSTSTTAASSASSPARPPARSSRWTSGPRRPQFSGTLLGGGDVLLDRRWPGNVAVLNFWGSWCAPCRVETPEFQQVYADVPRPGRRSSSG